jgi:hypothetical protein
MKNQQRRLAKSRSRQLDNRSLVSILQINADQSTGHKYMPLRALKTLTKNNLSGKSHNRIRWVPLLTAKEVALLRAGKAGPGGARVISTDGLAKIRQHIESMEIGIEIMRRDGSGLMSQHEIQGLFSDFVEGFVSEPDQAIDIWKYVASMNFDHEVLDRSGKRIPQEELAEMYASFFERFISEPERRVRHRQNRPAKLPTVITADHHLLNATLPESANPAAKKWLANLQRTILQRQAAKAA